MLCVYLCVFGSDLSFCKQTFHIVDGVLYISALHAYGWRSLYRRIDAHACIVWLCAFASVNVFVNGYRWWMQHSQYDYGIRSEKVYTSPRHHRFYFFHSLLFCSKPNLKYIFLCAAFRSLQFVRPFQVRVYFIFSLSSVLYTIIYLYVSFLTFSHFFFRCLPLLAAVVVVVVVAFALLLRFFGSSVAFRFEMCIHLDGSSFSLCLTFLISFAIWRVYSGFFSAWFSFPKFSYCFSAINSVVQGIAHVNIQLVNKIAVFHFHRYS